MEPEDISFPCHSFGPTVCALIACATSLVCSMASSRACCARRPGHCLLRARLRHQSSSRDSSGKLSLQVCPISPHLPHVGGRRFFVGAPETSPGSAAEASPVAGGEWSVCTSDGRAGRADAGGGGGGRGKDVCTILRIESPNISIQSCCQATSFLISAMLVSFLPCAQSTIRWTMGVGMKSFPPKSENSCSSNSSLARPSRHDKRAVRSSSSARPGS